MNRPYVECGTKKQGFRNTGAKKQCFLKKTAITVFAVEGFKFESIEDAKDKSKWDAAIKEKKLFPLFPMEEIASANTEPTYWEGEHSKVKTSDGKKITTYRSILGLCSYNALKSFDGKKGQLFELTTDPGVKAVITKDGEIKGQSVFLDVGRLIDSFAESIQGATVTINYKDFNEREDHGADLRTEWNFLEISGIHDVFVNIISATSTVIKFQVNTACGDDVIPELKSTDIEVRDASGALVTVSFVEDDSEGVYTVTGTGFANSFTVALKGVVTILDMNFESPEPALVSLT